ncbi:tumor necrosis factor receptor superfamily member 14-like [Megalops cyprinoides]|uniref:tumor necrosis factor receptor superfamily member 14-like n=1 Tax=Megalops cyprinoides TaxID=118141 RepID=UPI00186460C4|nr:tumor necrosis factor receptor superfamily member 14-like [Megalops cyprinoides]
MLLYVLLTVLLLCDVAYACGRAEYRIGDECCPMCGPGNRVYKHCTEYTSTSCVPCVGETFIDQPSGLIECFRCAVCDKGLELKIGKACTPTSNTVCGPLDQHFCTERDRKGSCTRAERRTVCKPGQFIKQNGTASTDTICGDCSDKTFSDGLSTNCKPHRE